MTTQLARNQRNNLRFLIVEVGTQISNLQDYITSKGKKISSGSFDRRGYIHNLKTRIHNDGYLKTLKDDNQVIAARAINNIVDNLERIAELCLDCTHHVANINTHHSPETDQYELLLDQVALGTSLIERAIQDNDSQLALKIAEVQDKLCKNCQQLHDKYSKQLKSRKNTAELIAALFIIKNITSMADTLLKICDATLSRNLGQMISVDRYYSLSRFVDHLQKQGASNNLVLDTVAETRSGSAVAGVSEANKEDIIAIFKDGKKQKLKEELESVKSWHEIYPGIAPRILSYQKQGQSAALLIEHLEGRTFENILLQGSNKILSKSLQELTITLDDIWQKTRQKKPVNAQYMQQLIKRLPDVYTIHPVFKQKKIHIAGLDIASFNKRVKQARKLEKSLYAPFSVYIHGDFNTDNIIYDPQQNKINFIDLHRSCYLDYVQDISVFMVSNYRLQTLDRPFRQRVLHVNMVMYQFVAEFARRNNDHTFELRLALGLARSLATSTRFTLDKTLAKAMFYRSQLLIQQVLKVNPKHSADYRVPIQEIFRG